MGLRTPQAPQMPQAPKAPLPEFAAQRQKVEQRINADTQGQQDAMQRRFAAGGMLNSGAAMKQQGILANQAQVNKTDALAGVDAAEMGEQQRRQEITDGRDFASSQAQMGRDFEGQQAQLGRDFAGSESALGRAFSAGESKLGRDQQGSQFDRSFKQSGDQFNQNFGLQKDQFREDKANTTFNRGIATKDLSDEEKAYMNSYTNGSGLKAIPNVPPPQQKYDPFTSAGKTYDRMRDRWV